MNLFGKFGSILSLRRCRPQNYAVCKYLSESDAAQARDSFDRSVGVLTGSQSAIRVLSPVSARVFFSNSDVGKEQLLGEANRFGNVLVSSPNTEEEASSGAIEFESWDQAQCALLRMSGRVLNKSKLKLSFWKPNSTSDHSPDSGVDMSPIALPKYERRKEELMAMSVDDRHQDIGSHIYFHLCKYLPVAMAAKITGMILENEVEDIIQILSSQEQFDDIIDQARLVLWEAGIDTEMPTRDSIKEDPPRAQWNTLYYYLSRWVDANACNQAAALKALMADLTIEDFLFILEDAESIGLKLQQL